MYSTERNGGGGGGQAQPDTHTNGSRDIVTARLLVWGLVCCEACCILGIVCVDAMGRPVPAVLGHLASAIAGSLAMAMAAIFRGRG
jgi:hypothetical protein